MTSTIYFNSSEIEQIFVHQKLNLYKLFPAASAVEDGYYVKRNDTQGGTDHRMSIKSTLFTMYDRFFIDYYINEPIYSEGGMKFC